MDSGDFSLGRQSHREHGGAMGVFAELWRTIKSTPESPWGSFWRLYVNTSQPATRRDFWTMFGVWALSGVMLVGCLPLLVLGLWWFFGALVLGSDDIAGRLFVGAVGAGLLATVLFAGLFFATVTLGLPALTIRRMVDAGIGEAPAGLIVFFALFGWAIIREPAAAHVAIIAVPALLITLVAVMPSRPKPAVEPRV